WDRAPAPPAAPAPATPPARSGQTASPAQARGQTPAVTVRRLRRGRLAIRKIDPWAVFKFSLVFYFCMLIILMLATGVIFTALKGFGVIGNIEQLMQDLEFDVTISGGLIFRWFFLIGVAGTMVASAITTFMAFLYNLIADVVGGIELLVTERE
ncbi:MAG: DUF3566 domain-containing protein, partial [Actinomycetota bacterium]